MNTAQKTRKKSSALLSALKNPTVMTQTENGALTFASTKSKVLDLFSTGGAIRQRSEAEVQTLFSEAFDENPVQALRTIFYLRDCRGGQGERNTFRIAFKWLCVNYPAVAMKTLKHIPLYGRWDDLLDATWGTPVFDEAAWVMLKQFKVDVSNDDDSTLTLVAKWMPSINTSSAQTRAQARRLVQLLEWNDKRYRKTLSRLRSRLKVVEKLMSARGWSGVNYDHVPSYAAKLYKKAFAKHDSVRYSKWQEGLAKGTSKVNASTLFPYDILREVRSTSRGDAALKTLEAQWKALPNYLGKNQRNALVVADVSGSMTWASSSPKPIDVCISLAIYFAERNKGFFANHFMTFSDDSKLVSLKGSDLWSKYHNLSQAEWGGSTNLQAAFNNILKAAVENDVPADEMPATLMIISDMEFNCVSDGGTNFDAMKRKYAAAGYELPQVVFWNVQARQTQSPVTKNERGVTLVSGCSPSIMKQVLEGASQTPYEFMLEVINSARYEQIVL
jgi:hypothetical protein